MSKLRDLVGEIPLAVWLTVIAQAVVVIMFLGRLDTRMDNLEKRAEIIVQQLLKKQ